MKERKKRNSCSVEGHGRPPLRVRAPNDRTPGSTTRIDRRGAMRKIGRRRRSVRRTKADEALRVDCTDDGAIWETERQRGVYVHGSPLAKQSKRFVTSSAHPDTIVQCGHRLWASCCIISKRCATDKWLCRNCCRAVGTIPSNTSALCSCNGWIGRQSG